MLVSIITVCFNSSKTINETLLSVKNQTYPNLEHIIIDDSSSDSTLDVIKKFPHVSKIISEPDNGIYDAMNKGIKIATGNIIGILNSDDIYSSNDTISNIVLEFEKEKKLDMVYGNIAFFKKKVKNIIRYWKSANYKPGFFEYGKSIPHPSLFVTAKTYKEVGLYKIDNKISSDLDFMLRAFIIHKKQSRYINATIVQMRYGGESTKNIKNIILGNKEIIKVFKENNINKSQFYFFNKLVFKLLQLKVVRLS
jgi:glycosyltransferase involved in cell wall biosynthesis